MGERAVAWLAERAGAVPPALAARMESAAGSVEDCAAVSDTLSAASLTCLREAIRLGDERAAALPLLAADALVTYAVEAATADPALLHRLARTLSPGALAGEVGAATHVSEP